MKIFKFGGASVRSAEGVKNLASIIRNESDTLFVIVSAMGKTTNALEKLLESFYGGRKEEALAALTEVIGYHDSICTGLWSAGFTPERTLGFYDELKNIISCGDPSCGTYEMWYDRIVSYGELISTSIISEYLSSSDVPNKWVDMRRYMITTDRHKDANIDLETSAQRLIPLVGQNTSRVYVGQGFIGATAEGAPTTIGREGSDYSAAVVGYILNAESVTIWKDVKGIMNGDPKIFDDVAYIPEMNYLDAIELAYSGAQIIHPKTIKPLQNKNIPLYVRCFLDPGLPGSVIKAGVSRNKTMPVMILKPAQVLLTIRANDLSFILEERFARVFGLLEEYRIKVNMIQSSAVNLDLCIDNSRHLNELTERLRNEGYFTRYNTDMELLTIRNYNEQQKTACDNSPEVYLMQRTRGMLQVVRKHSEQ